MTGPATLTLAQPEPLNGVSSLSPHPATPLSGDLAPLTLDDILPDRQPTATEPSDSWRRLGEIKDGIIEELTIRHKATE